VGDALTNETSLDAASVRIAAIIAEILVLVEIILGGRVPIAAASSA
jgi:hypothetical protein